MKAEGIQILREREMGEREKKRRLEMPKRNANDGGRNLAY